jgi:hypothetical protein
MCYLHSVLYKAQRKRGRTRGAASLIRVLGIMMAAEVLCPKTNLNGKTSIVILEEFPARRWWLMLVI